MRQYGRITSNLIGGLMTKSRLLLSMLLVLALGVGILACGSSDDGGGGSFSVSMALFSNTTYVDYQRGSGDMLADASRLEGYLITMGHKPLAFNGISASAINDALSGNQLLFIPPLAINGLSGDLDASAKAAIESYVSSGGTLVLVGDTNGYDAALVNSVFGFSIINTTWDGNIIYGIYNATESAGTLFENPDVFFPNEIIVYETIWDKSSLPAGASSIFDKNMVPDGGTGIGTAVAYIEYGSGEILFMSTLSVEIINKIMGGNMNSYGYARIEASDMDLIFDVYGPDKATRLFMFNSGAVIPLGHGISSYIRITDDISTPRAYIINTDFCIDSGGGSVCYSEDAGPPSSPDDKYEPDNTADDATYIDSNRSQTHYISSGDADWFRYVYTAW